MKKLALILIMGMLLSFAGVINSSLRAQDPAAADTLSIDDQAPTLYHPDEEGEESESESSEWLWIGVAIVVVVGGVLVWKISSKKK